MSDNGTEWASDVPISLPVPPSSLDRSEGVKMDGFLFCYNGLFHDVSEAELSEYRIARPANDVSFDIFRADRDVD